jgi:hypothetical protein
LIFIDLCFPTIHYSLRCFPLTLPPTPAVANMSVTTPPTDDLANLSIQDINQNSEAPSPNSMMVDDPEEHVVEPNGTETDSLTLVNSNSNPETVSLINADAMETTETVLASDCALPLCPLVAFHHELVC